MAIAVLEQNELEALMITAFEKGMEKGTELTIRLFNSTKKKQPKEQTGGVLLTQKQSAKLLKMDARTFKKHMPTLTRVENGKYPKFYLKDIMARKEEINLANEQ